MDILKRPGSLSLSGNMDRIVVSTNRELLFVLRDSGGAAIVENSYAPNDQNRMEIDLKSIVTPLLSLTLKNVSNPYQQTKIAQTFTAELSEVVDAIPQNTQTITFTVLRAGVDELADSVENFLEQNFLTWQPNMKPVTYYSPEFLTYYAVTAATMRCQATMEDGTTAELTLASIPAGECWTVPMQYAVIAGKLSKLPAYYDVWMETPSGQRLTYIQRYYADDMRSEVEEWVLFENSLGGIDTFRAYGDSDNTAEHTHNVVEIDEEQREYRVDTERNHTKNTGYLDTKERTWLLDFFPSLGKYIYTDQHVRQIVVTESDVNYKAKTLPSSYTFTYRYATTQPYMNLPRTDTPQEVMELKVPDVGSFTIAPRLVEFPRQVLSRGALFPIQDPYSEGWGTTTMDAIQRWIVQMIESEYDGNGGIGHHHDNISLLDALALMNDYLTQNGKKISAGYADEARTFKNNEAPEAITFLMGLMAQAMIHARKGADFGVFMSGMTGTGGMIDEKGNAELQSLFVRQFISAPRFVFNEVAVTKAEQWLTNGCGTILSVNTKMRTITLKLEENEYGSVAVGDICRGIYADIDNVYGSDSNEEGKMDECNFAMHRGFFTTYFYVRSIVRTGRGECIFEYGKKSPDGPEPCAFMDFVQYGNFSDENRQSSIYFSSKGKSYIEVLDGVKTWEIQPANRVSRFGWLGNLTVEYKDGRKVQLKGNGLFAQNNIYFGGNIEFLQGLKEVEDLKELATAYDVSLSQYQSVVTVDDMGNVINGLYTEDEAKTTKQYRISTAVFVRKGTQILLEEDPKNEDVTEGHYRLHTISDDCSTMVENSTVFVTGIRNIKDGVADTEDDATFDYDEMRKMSDAYIQVVVDLEGKTTKTVAMPIRIQHDSLPFMVCDLTNQAAQVAWNTKTGKYIGLPIQSTVNLTYHNEPWEISECKVVGGMPSGLTATITRNANGKSYDISINGTFAADTLPQVSNVQITVIGRYAGANYEYTKVLTIAKSADVVTYDVVPSADSIVVDKFDGMSASLVYCDVYCTSSDDKRYKVTTLPDGYSLRYGIDTDTPTNSISPGTAISVTANNKKVVFALYDNNGTICDMEDVPVLAWGKDGKGIEYIFFLSHSETPPTNPTPSDWSSSSAYQSQTTEYVPTWLGWTDDPSGVSAAFQYEYVAIRTSINGVWQPFSDPALHDHYGKHAPRATVTDNVITIPTDSKGEALDSFSETINFSLLVDAKACTISGITKSGSLTNVSCSIDSSGGSATISCSSDAKLGNKAQTLNFTVTGTLDGASYQDTVTVKIVPNVTGEDGDGYEYIYFLCDESKIPTTAPVRSSGRLSVENGIQWVDDVPTMTDTERYIYVAWKTGIIGSDGTFSKPKLFLYKAKDGVGEVSAYQMVENMPTLKPTTVDYEAFLAAAGTASLGNGWTKQIVKQGAKMVLGGTVMNVSGNNSAWTSYTDGGYTWWKSAAISNSETTSMRISFTTSEDNMRVTFYLKAYSESYDKIALSTLDSSTINSNTAIGGNGVSSGAIYFDVEKAGTHYVTVQYSKDSSVSSYLDSGLVRMATNECYVLRYPPIYRCHGTVVEKVITWGDITKETGDQGDKGDKGDKGDQGDQGDRGYNGCIFRTSEWKPNTEYRNDSEAENDGVKYIDIVYIENDDATYGWDIYQCKTTHTSGSSFSSTYWQKFSNLTPIYTPLIVAKGAVFKFAQGQQFNIMENNTIWGSFRHVPNSTDYAFWIGGYMGSVAPFAVTKGGKLVAANAEITGKITATSGTFDNCTIKDTCTITKIDAVKGTIGGFNITQYGITSSDGVVGIGSTGISLNKSGVYVALNVLNCMAPNETTLKDRAMFRIGTTSSYASDLVEITSDFMTVEVPIYFTLPKYASAKSGQLCRGDGDNHVYIHP